MNVRVPVYLVLDDFGTLGRAWRETEATQTDAETIIENMLTGQYERPCQVVAFNPAEGWSRDVSAEIAQEVIERARKSGSALTPAVAEFVADTVGEPAAP
jgi:hypothetical protein